MPYLNMKAIIEPGSIGGTLKPPPSKSMTQRAYAAALLHKGKTIIHNAGASDDEKAALQVIQQLGAKIIQQTADAIEILSNGVYPLSQSINCGESGLSARLFTPIAAISGQEISIVGKGSLLRRPMDGIKDVLSALNVTLPGFNGYLPFTLQGPLKARSIKVDASDSSQFLSGLLFALSACVTEQVNIEVTGLKSRPYIDLTLDVLAQSGRTITHNNYKEFYINPALFTYNETNEINIETDWSSAAYFLVAGAIAGEITIENVLTTSKQADKAILEVLRIAGAEIVNDNDNITVKSSNLVAFEFDATHCPDLFPVVAILASCCYGESCIRGVHRLFHKESNRVVSITEMLQDFAVPWSVEDDTLFITGVPHLQGTVIDCYMDHRIVMAASIGALRANGRVDIIHAESVNKSYPGFFKDFILYKAKCIFIDDL